MLFPIVEEGGCFAKENECDFIVALGGGSVIDASKAIGIMATNDSGDLWDYVMFGSGKQIFRRCRLCQLWQSQLLQAQDLKQMEGR